MESLINSIKFQLVREKSIGEGVFSGINNNRTSFQRYWEMLLKEVDVIAVKNEQRKYLLLGDESFNTLEAKTIIQACLEEDNRGNLFLSDYAFHREICAMGNDIWVHRPYLSVNDFCFNKLIESTLFTALLEKINYGDYELYGLLKDRDIYEISIQDCIEFKNLILDLGISNECKELFLCLHSCIKDAKFKFVAYAS